MTDLAVIERYRVRNAADRPARIANHRSPDNVKCAHLLSAAFPQAKFVHPVGGERAMFNSVKKLSLSPRKVYALTAPSAVHWRGDPVPSDIGHKTFPWAQRLRWFGKQILHSHVIKPLRQKSRRRTIRVSFK